MRKVEDRRWDVEMVGPPFSRENDNNYWEEVNSH